MYNTSLITSTGLIRFKVPPPSPSAPLTKQVKDLSLESLSPELERHLVNLALAALTAPDDMKGPLHVSDGEACWLDIARAKRALCQLLGPNGLDAKHFPDRVRDVLPKMDSKQLAALRAGLRHVEARTLAKSVGLTFPHVDIERELIKRMIQTVAADVERQLLNPESKPWAEACKVAVDELERTGQIKREAMQETDWDVVDDMVTHAFCQVLWHSTRLPLERAEKVIACLDEDVVETLAAGPHESETTEHSTAIVDLAWDRLDAIDAARESEAAFAADVLAAAGADSQALVNIHR